MHLLETAAEWTNLSGESRSETEMQENPQLSHCFCLQELFLCHGSYSWCPSQSPAHRHTHHRSRIQPGTPRREWSLLSIWTPLLYLMDTGLHSSHCHSNPFLLFQIWVMCTSQTTLHSTIKIQSNYTRGERTPPEISYMATPKGEMFSSRRIWDPLDTGKYQPVMLTANTQSTFWPH